MWEFMTNALSLFFFSVFRELEIWQNRPRWLKYSRPIWRSQRVMKRRIQENNKINKRQIKDWRGSLTPMKVQMIWEKIPTMKKSQVQKIRKWWWKLKMLVLSLSLSLFILILALLYTCWVSGDLLDYVLALLLQLAISMATKAASLARELKSLKSDLCFIQERCTLLEEENRRLRDGFDKGIGPEEDDLVACFVHSWVTSTYYNAWMSQHCFNL